MDQNFRIKKIHSNNQNLSKFKQLKNNFKSIEFINRDKN